MVTGASGFLGRTLCRVLVDRGVSVRAVVRRPEAAPPGSEPRVVAGLDETEQLGEALHGVGTVVHLAARVHRMNDPVSDPLSSYRAINVEGTRAVMRAARAAGVRTFVFASSTKAVGEWTDVPWTEAEPPRPTDPYGVTKLEAELAVRELARAAPMHTVILRLPLVYGAGAKGNILRLFQAVDRGVPLPFGSVRNRRSLLYAGNFVAAVDAVVSAAGANGETFFVSDDADLSTPELVRMIARALGRPARLVPVPAALFQMAARLGDVAHPWVRLPFNSGVARRLIGSLAVDISKLRRLTGFVPPYPPEEGLRVMAEWYRTHHAT
jgi:nucleoside-diphosphate-sugar epimerase